MLKCSYPLGENPGLCQNSVIRLSGYACKRLSNAKLTLGHVGHVNPENSSAQTTWPFRFALSTICINWSMVFGDEDDCWEKTIAKGRISNNFFIILILSME